MSSVDKQTNMSFNHGMRWNENHCGLCDKEITDSEGNTLEGCTAQSCSCNQVFCYPYCFRHHQKSTGDRT